MTDLLSKRAVARHLLHEGSVLVHLDPRQRGVKLPDHLLRREHVCLELGFDTPIPIPDLKVNAAGISGSLQFPSRRGSMTFACVLPWCAVFAVTSIDRRSGLYWRDSMPATVAGRLPALRPPLRLIRGDG